MSGLLIIIVIGWIMNRTIRNEKRDFRWNFASVLEDLDFGDDIVLMSSRLDNLQQRAKVFAEYAKEVGFHINKRKFAILKLNEKPLSAVIFDNDPIEDIDTLVHCGENGWN